MTNQYAGLSLIGTVTGTGNISLTSIEPNVGSIPVSNLTVGQSAWCIIEAGTGASKQREISYCTYSASTPNAGILTRDVTFLSTSSNATISFAADTSVIVRFDVPDAKIPHFDGSGDLVLESELATALGLEAVTENQSVTAGNVNTLFTANSPEKAIDFKAWQESDPTNYVAGTVIAGPDAGSGSSTTAQAINVVEAGNLTLEQSTVDFNIRNGSGSTITFSKAIRISRAAS